MLTSDSSSFWMWIHLIILVAAVVFAIKCNKPGDRVLPVIGAVLFPEIYLIQRGIRRYVIHEENYGCGTKTKPDLYDKEY